MATYASGVTATWDGTSFGEVTDLAVTHGGSLPLARASTWTLDVGTIEIKCLSTANISAATADLGHSLGNATWTARSIASGPNCTTEQLAETKSSPGNLAEPSV